MTEMYPARIYVEFKDGSWINSLCPHFQDDLQELIELLGPPVLVEYRPAK
jgi:hypothetical protein